MQLFKNPKVEKNFTYAFYLILNIIAFLLLIHRMFTQSILLEGLILMGIVAAMCLLGTVLCIEGLFKRE